MYQNVSHSTGKNQRGKIGQKDKLFLSAWSEAINTHYPIQFLQQYYEVFFFNITDKKTSIKRLHEPPTGKKWWWLSEEVFIQTCFKAPIKLLPSVWKTAQE